MTLDIITSDMLAPFPHGFFGRAGGSSSGIFAGLNCGHGSSDQREAVALNRSRVAAALDVPPDALPRDVRARLAVGRSTHTPEQLDATRNEDVDYVAFGPVFGTTSKASEYEARGLEALAEAVRLAAPRPLIAIGGIQSRHLSALREAGAAGLAVISVVAAAADPVAAARALVAGFTGSEGGRA